MPIAVPEVMRIRQFVRNGLIVIGVLLTGTPALAQSSVTLAWDPNPEPDIAGYTISWGTRPGVFTASADVGENTLWTISGLDPHQRYYFTVQAYNDDRVYSSPAAAVSNDGVFVTTGAPLPTERPSLFWHNTTTGELITWHMSGTNVLDSRKVSIASVPTQWAVAGTGDVNRDGHSDILFRHKTEGWLAVWYLQNNNVIFTGYLSINRNDVAWKIHGLGDANGDGYADVIFQHDDGRLAVWFLQGTTVISTQYLSIPRQTNPLWRISALADVNRDGTADLVWHSNDGWLATWLLRGSTVITTQFFSINRMQDTNWKLVTAGQTDGVSPPALVWQHRDGWLAFWYVNGTNVLSTLYMNPNRINDPNWKIVGTR